MNSKLGIALFFQRLHLALGLCEILLHFLELRFMRRLGSQILELV
jgi:hypothetical protein